MKILNVHSQYNKLAQEKLDYLFSVWSDADQAAEQASYENDYLNNLADSHYSNYRKALEAHK